MKTLVVIRENVPGLNGKDGLIREHFHAARERKVRYTMLIWSQTRNQHPGPVKITFTRYGLQYMDWDNMCASFKHIGDALVKAKVIQDDKPGIIHVFQPRQVKVKHRIDQKSTIEIEDLTIQPPPQTQLDL
jgi:hypothetical protein